MSSEGHAEVRLETRTVQEVLVLKVLDPRIRYEQSESFGEQLEQALEAYDQPKVLLDLQEVHYLTSNVLGRIVQLHKDLQARGKELKLVVVNKTVLEVFRITNLDKVLRLYRDVHQALNAF